MILEGISTIYVIKVTGLNRKAKIVENIVSVNAPLTPPRTGEGNGGLASVTKDTIIDDTYQYALDLKALQCVQRCEYVWVKNSARWLQVSVEVNR